MGYQNRETTLHSHSSILKRNLIYCIGFNIARSLLLLTVVGSVFDAFIFMISKGSNTIVGITASVGEVAQLFALFPVAFVMDRNNRGIVAKSSVCVHIIGLFSFAIGVYLSNVILIIVSLIIISIATEFSSSSSECIFLDSIDNNNNRAAWIAKKSAALYIGAAISNTLVLLFFICPGKQWQLENCRTILLLTAGFCCPLIVMCLWPIQDPRHLIVPNTVDDGNGTTIHASIEEQKDRSKQRNFKEYDSNSLTKSLRGERKHEIFLGPESTNVTNGNGRSITNSLETTSWIGSEEDVYINQEDSKSEDERDSSKQIDAHETSLLNHLKGYQELIPFNVALGAFLRCLGCGMSSRFFNLFFINEFHFSPIHVTLVAIGALVSIPLLIPVAAKSGKLMGRGYSVVAINFVAFALYLSLAIIQTPWLFIPIHILRSGLQGANVPVETSMIVDTTRSELVGKHRGKWLTINSVSNISWFITAPIGGYIVDRFGYRAVFHITAWLYGLGALSLFPVALTFPRWIDAKQKSSYHRLLH